HVRGGMRRPAARLLILGRGGLIAGAPSDERIAGSSLATVVVRVPAAADQRRLHVAVSTEADCVATQGDELVISGLAGDRVGDLAHRLGARLHELHTRHASLEEAYMQLTADSLEFTTGTAGDHTATTPEGALHR